MNRRQFLKTVAATAAGVTAAVVAPSVGKEPVPFRPNPVQKHWMQQRGFFQSPLYGNPLAVGACGVNAGKMINGLPASEQLLGSRLVLPNGNEYKCVRFTGGYKIGQMLRYACDDMVTVKAV